MNFKATLLFIILHFTVVIYAIAQDAVELRNKIDYIISEIERSDLNNHLSMGKLDFHHIDSSISEISSLYNRTFEKESVDLKLYMSHQVNTYIIADGTKKLVQPDDIPLFLVRLSDKQKNKCLIITDNLKKTQYAPTIIPFDLDNLRLTYAFYPPRPHP